MKINIRKKAICIFMIVMMLAMSVSKVYSVNTDYPEKKDRDKENKNKEIGLAVIEKEDIKDTNSYFYLYYDSQGEVHIVQYIQNPMKSEEEKKWILKTDADNTKAKELGAKEYYKEEEELKNNENREATELYKKITEATGQKRSLYDYIEGTTEDEEPYTIESILLNKVPIFDVNFFSETAGGKEIRDDSIVAIIRKIIAVWYVSFRNVALVVLAILIIYYGIRMAISTIASEKARYKQIALGWLKSLIIVLTIHYIMYVVIYFNEAFIEMIASSNEDEASIYNTIKTRALDDSLKIAIPATIMYFTLLIIWIRFIIAYFKRTFAVAFLVILAPLVGIRYTIESASGKGSGIVTNWIQRFVTSVFIQSIHFLIYTVFVKNALEAALDDLNGFFIALFFLNFILAADKIFINIFKFEFSPKTLDNIRKPFRPAKDLIEWKASYEIGKSAVMFAKDIGTTVGGEAKNALNRGYIRATDILDDKYGGSHRSELSDRVNEFRNNIDDKFIADEVDENGRPIKLGKVRSQLNSKLKLRKLSRVRGRKGIEARKKLRIKKDLRKRRFKSEFKIIRDISAGVSGVVLAVPYTFASEDPSMGIAMITRIPNLFTSNNIEIKRVRRRIKRADKELDKTIKAVNSVNSDMDRVEKELQKLSELEKRSAVEQLKEVNNLSANYYSIQQALIDYLKKRKVKQINEDELDLIISDLVDNMQGDLTKEERESIKQNAKIIILANNRNRNNSFTDETENNEEPTKNESRTTASTNQKVNENNIESLEEIPIIEFEQEEVVPIDDEEENIRASNVKENDEENQGEENAVQNNESESRRETNTANNESDSRRETNTTNNESDRRKEINETNNESDRRNQQQQEERNPLFDFGEIIKGIEEAVIEEKTDNKFTAKLARIINNIKDTTQKENEEVGSRTIADTNKFLDSL